MIIDEYLFFLKKDILIRFRKELNIFEENILYKEEILRINNSLKKYIIGG